MKQTFTNLNKLLLLLLMTVVSFSASAHCADDGDFYNVDLTPAGPGETESFGCVYGGEYYLFTAVAGETYYITSCGSPYDSQITLRDINGNFLAFDETLLLFFYNETQCGFKLTIIIELKRD